jgi:hypothetical protein
MDLEEVADELYEVPPEEFMAARTAFQEQAKADGDKALAKAIGGLPKPSTAAWVSNLLVRARREEIEGLVELGDLLRDAQQNLAGDQLRALNTQRGQLLNALTRRASALARERGHPISTAIADQVMETLRAAMSDREAGQALLSGRLVSAMSYSGLGTATARPDLRLVPPPPAPEKRPAEKAAQPRKAAPKTGESAAERREREREERRRAEEERHRREVARAREVAEQAAVAAEEARAAADEQRRQTEELAVEHADLQARVEELADQLADAERHAAEAAAALKRAQRRSTASEREAAEAADARDRAVAHAEQLAAEGPG